MMTLLRLMLRLVRMLMLLVNIINHNFIMMVVTMTDGE